MFGKTSISDLVAALSLAFVVVSTISGAYLSWRQRQLRKEEVLVWANRAIDKLQILVLLCSEAHLGLPDEVRRDKILEISLSLSVLVEQGRIYFRNEPAGDYGLDNPPAYRGLRPAILDKLIVGHLVAEEWPTANIEDRRLMVRIAQRAEREFVSLAQKEVGRARTATPETRDPGTGVSLRRLVDEERVRVGR